MPDRELTEVIDFLPIVKGVGVVAVINRGQETGRLRVLNGARRQSGDWEYGQAWRRS
ncbi:Hypothetical protein SMAX5B_008945 [Scophthalmus maximus]|uniref:Uncharacterized protein n=1 Tax=Scophthalmus maximus TaxID=52904 RepID=A0A2U9CI36_SCOMX|nr:Hypothetical protein SMAX5B_008945 [Scophthalmus maximus]